MWKMIANNELQKYYDEHYNSSTIRIGTDMSEVFYVLPNNLTFGEKVDEIGDDMLLEQMLMLIESVEYNGNYVLWIDTPGETSSPEDVPDFASQTSAQDAGNGEKDSLKEEIRMLRSTMEGVLKDKEELARKMEEYEARIETLKSTVEKLHNQLENE